MRSQQDGCIYYIYFTWPGIMNGTKGKTFSIFFSDNNLFKYMMHQLAKTIPLKTKFSFELNWDPWLGHFPLIHTPPRKISMPHVPTLSGLLIWMFAVMTSARQVSKCQVKMPEFPRSDTAQCSATQPSPPDGCLLVLQTIHRFHNHGEGPCLGLLLGESAY